VQPGRQNRQKKPSALVFSEAFVGFQWDIGSKIKKIKKIKKSGESFFRKNSEAPVFSGAPGPAGPGGRAYP
jgi:hypothetical protein